MPPASAARRIDVHHHIVPDFYRDALAKAGIGDAGGRTLPDWSPEAALDLMDLLGTATAIVSISTPGAGFLTEETNLAQRLNDAVVAVQHVAVPANHRS